MTIKFCLAKAEECEALAFEAVEESKRLGWLLMSQDWLAAAAELDAEVGEAESPRTVAKR